MLIITLKNFASLICLFLVAKEIEPLKRLANLELANFNKMLSLAVFGIEILKILGGKIMS